MLSRYWRLAVAIVRGCQALCLAARNSAVAGPDPHQLHALMELLYAPSARRDRADVAHLASPIGMPFRPLDPCPQALTSSATSRADSSGGRCVLIRRGRATPSHLLKRAPLHCRLSASRCV